MSMLLPIIQEIQMVQPCVVCQVDVACIIWVGILCWVYVNGGEKEHFLCPGKGQ